jgi:hypothetical protein
VPVFPSASTNTETRSVDASEARFGIEIRKTTLPASSFET